MPRSVTLPPLLTVVVLLCAPGMGVPMPPDDDVPGTELPDVCVEPILDGVVGVPYLNGLPVVEQALEIVAEHVKVAIETTPRCALVSPSSLPFQWTLVGPTGPLAMGGETTLRPTFTPVLAGAYQAQLTFCPLTCVNKHVGPDVVTIPPQTSTFTFIVVTEMPVPPGSQPVLTPEALKPPTDAELEAEVAFHEARDRKCAFPGWGADAHTPQLVPTRPWASAADYRLLEGRVVRARIAGNDNELNHWSHDVGIHVVPDPRHLLLKMLEKPDMEIEWESDSLPGAMRPMAGDRISAFGFHTYDCHHSPIVTEIHPAVLTAVHRTRPVLIPEGWAPPDGPALGSNIYVPGIVTDIWANVNGGEMTGNCSLTGLHQEAVAGGVLFGDCIEGPNPIQRVYSFNIYLPEDPQQRAATAGLSAPAVPLFYAVDPAGFGPLPVIEPSSDGGVTFLRVTVDLNGYAGFFGTYRRRIRAAWVLPSADNWGLERWKVGISSMRVFDDHDWGAGDWVFWAATNNTDREWTRLLNGDSVHEGDYTFGGRPWETASPYSDRNLGPHLLLFNPRFGHYFPGNPLRDLSQSLQLHTAGYDAEFFDDPVGAVNDLFDPDPAAMAIGERRIRERYSSLGPDYRLTYFYERQGPVGASLTLAGQALSEAYTLGSDSRCTPLGRTGICVLLPEDVTLAATWDPSQEAPPARGELRWADHLINRPQGAEPFSLTGIPLDVLGRQLASLRGYDPERARRFFAELRAQFDQVRGTPLEDDYARALPAFERVLPADLWQLHFGDIDPTPVDLVLKRITMTPPGAAAGESVAFAAEIENRGSGAAASFTARITVDGVELRPLIVPSLESGATTTVGFPAWTAVPGRHTVRATADALGQIAEPVETDNHLERSVVIGHASRGLPDLTAASAHVQPVLPRAGQPSSFVARIWNRGGNALDAFTVTFAVDGVTIGGAVVAGLPAGGRADVKSPPWTRLAGRHTLRVSVDALHAVAESVETNNVLVHTFQTHRARTRAAYRTSRTGN